MSTYGTRLMVIALTLAAVAAQDVVPVLRSCSELRLAGYSIDGEYMIDPDGPGRGLAPFAVYCEMDHRTRDVAIVEHDQIFHGVVPMGFDTPGQFRVPVTYEGGVSVEQLANLADISAGCRQYVSVDCHNSRLWHNDEIWGYWVSRNGSIMTNWGTPTGTQGCQCSLDSSCARNQSCNCDADDNVWRKDEGDITDKTTLPVTEIRFGDTGDDNEKALYKVGPLKCWGMDQETFPSCEALAAAGYTGEGDYLIHPPGGCAQVLKCNEKYLMNPPPILRSCEELRLAGYTDNGEYMIDPDFPSSGLPSFLVNCNMTSGTTIVKHDRQGKLTSNGLEGYGEHHIVVHYSGASIQQVAGLADTSGNCQQYISKECHGSVSWSMDDQDMYTWWVSRNGVKMANWATPTGTEGCACSLTRSCQKANKRCNCDSNDPVWREDHGTLTDKSTLPVSQVRVGDTGQSTEVALFTLGELTCTGIGSPVYTSCASLQEDGISGGGPYLIDPDGSEGSKLPTVVRCESTEIKTPVAVCPTQQEVQSTTTNSGNKLTPTQLAHGSQDSQEYYPNMPKGSVISEDSRSYTSTNNGHSEDLSVYRLNVSVQALNVFVVGVTLMLLIVIAILIMVTLVWKKMLALKPANSSCDATVEHSNVRQGPMESPVAFSNVRFFNSKSELQYETDQTSLI